MEKEMRKDIPGFEGHYVIEGDKIFSLKFGKEKELIPQTLASGYQQIGLTKDGVRTFFYLHRLVAEAFVPNPHNKPEINHINGIKWDNRPENLQWSTKSENLKHAYAQGLRVAKKGEDHGRAILRNSEILEIFRLREEGLKMRELSELFGCSTPYICKILHRKVRRLD